MPAEGNETPGGERPGGEAPAPVPAGAVEVGTRVYLRPPGEADEAAFLAMVAASRDLHYGWIHPPSTPHEFQAWLVRGRQGKTQSFLVCRLGDGGMCGVFNLVEIASRSRTAFCTYYANAASIRQGFMGEGMALLLRHAFATLGFLAIGASIQPDNAASMALVQRAGFRREKAPPRYLRLVGVWRGHPTWSVTAQRWRQLNNGEADDGEPEGA